MISNAVWMRIIPIVLIALAAGGLCAQAACTGGSGDATNNYGGYK